MTTPETFNGLVGVEGEKKINRKEKNAGVEHAVSNQNLGTVHTKCQGLLDFAAPGSSDRIAELHETILASASSVVHNSDRLVNIASKANDGVTNLTTEATASVGKLNGILEKIEKSVEGAQTTVDTINSFLTSTLPQPELIQTILTFVNGALFSMSSKSLTPLYQSLIQYCINKGFTFLTVKLFAHKILDMIISYFTQVKCQSLEEAFDIIQQSPQQKLHEFMTNILNIEWVKTNFTKFGDLIPTLLAATLSFITLLFVGVKDINLNSLMNEASLIGRCTKGVSDFYMLFDKIWKWLDDKICLFVNGKDRDQFTQYKMFPLLDRSISILLKIKEIPNLKDVLASDRELCREIKRIFSLLDHYQDLANTNRNFTLATRVKNVRFTLKIVEEMANCYANCNSKPRVPPVCMSFAGTPGVGKTELMTLIVDRLSKDLYESAQYSDLVFDRKIETEYWDGYRTTHKIVKYDDAFQMPDSAQMSRKSEFMEVIRLCNTDSCLLHMAAVEDKNNTYFHSDFVMITTNCLNVDPKSIKDKGAYLRRIDFDCKVSVNPKFAVMKRSGLPMVSDKKIYFHHYPNKTEEDYISDITSPDFTIPKTDIYNIECTHWDSVKEEMVTKVYNFEEFYPLIVAKKKLNTKIHSKYMNESFVGLDGEIREEIKIIAQGEEDAPIHTAYADSYKSFVGEEEADIVEKQDIRALDKATEKLTNLGYSIMETRVAGHLVTMYLALKKFLADHWRKILGVVSLVTVSGGLAWLAFRPCKLLRHWPM
jgi:hypothetical protein